MGAQVFVLPYLDITGFTVLFAVVTAVSGWIATATPRFYLGVQLALAFYLINLQEFAVQSSLAVARDLSSAYCSACYPCGWFSIVCG